MVKDTGREPRTSKDVRIKRSDPAETQNTLTRRPSPPTFTSQVEDAYTSRNGIRHGDVSVVLTDHCKSESGLRL